MHPLIENNLNNIRILCEQHHIKTLYVFGSINSGAFHSKSDVDFLYEMDYDGFDFNDPATYTYDPFEEHFILHRNLEHLLKRKVDLIPFENFRNKYFKESVEKSKLLVFSNERHQKISA